MCFCDYSWGGCFSFLWWITSNWISFSSPGRVGGARTLLFPGVCFLGVGHQVQMFVLAHLEVLRERGPLWTKVWARTLCCEQIPWVWCLFFFLINFVSDRYLSPISWVDFGPCCSCVSSPVSGSVSICSWREPLNGPCLVHPFGIRGAVPAPRYQHRAMLTWLKPCGMVPCMEWPCSLLLGASKDGEPSLGFPFALFLNVWYQDGERTARRGLQL